jgi:ferredoxin like protein
MKIISVEDKLSVNKFDIDKDVHIRIADDICQTCNHHACIYVCPASCYKLSEGGITFSYEGCLECGSCNIACDKGAIDWTLPRPGFGICYQYG